MNEATVNIEQIEPLYTFRPLQAEDTFLMCKIIKAIGIKEFKAVFSDGGLQEMITQMVNKEKEEGAQEEGNNSAVVKAGIAVFIDLADVIIGNLPKCESEIFQMLSKVSNLSEKEIRKLGFADFFGMIIDFLKKEEFRDFIKVVSRLF